MDYKKKKYGIDTERINFQKTEINYEIPDLLLTQTESFKLFLEEGIDKIFNEIYPISSKKLTVSFIKSELKLPKNRDESIEESMDKGSNFYAPLKAKFRITNNETGAKVMEDTAFIANLPLMTDGASFIINGSERVIISQIVRAPGVYFENMKTSRSQSSSDSSIFKLSSIIPARGAWIEFDYKDYKLLGVDPTDIKIRIDKSKRIKLAMLLYSLGLSDEDIIGLYGNHELLIETLSKVPTLKKEPIASRREIFKILNPGDRLSEDQVNNWFSNLLAVLSS